MIETLQRYKLILFFVGLIVFGLAFLSLFSDESFNTTLTANRPATAVDAASQELLAILLQLRTITLSENIFSDDTFRQLQDFSQEIPPQPVGRDNPFAPLPVLNTLGSGGQ